MRYVRRPVASGWVEDETFADAASFTPSLEVDGPAEIDTGLIDCDGYSIYRVQAPIGFGRDDEW